MPATETTGEIRAALYVRETLPAPAQKCRQKTIARLERLTAEGPLDGHSVTSWAKRIPLSGTDSTEARNRYNEFSQWARENDARLTPFFDTRECYSMATGEKRTELVFPAVCVAIYEGDELRTVAPHATASTTESVQDCLERLAEQPLEGTQQTTMTAD